MEARRIELRIVIASVVGVLFVEGAMRMLSTHSMAAIGAARLVETALFLSIVLRWGHSLGSVGLERGRIGRGLRRGLIWSAGFALVALLVLSVLLVAGVNPLGLLKTPVPARPAGVTLFFLVGGVIGPVTEEIFFRGILYGYFRRWGFVAAMVLSTILFIFPHLATQRIPVTQAVGGFVFAAAYEVEGSLMAPITVHALGNMAIFTISLVLYSGG